MEKETLARSKDVKHSMMVLSLSSLGTDQLPAKSLAQYTEWQCIHTKQQDVDGYPDLMMNVVSAHATSRRGHDYSCNETMGLVKSINDQQLGWGRN
jgi:hypothetical protein